MPSPPPDSTPGAAPRHASIVLGLLVAYLAASALSFWPYTVDDAFISLRYAQNLVAGHGLVWNPGERVEGFSNPFWTLYGAAGLTLGVAPVLWLKLGGLACALATVPATYMLARRVGGSVVVGLLATAIVATNASVALWSIAGLETTSFMLLLVLFALRFEGELAARGAGEARRPLSAVLFVLVWCSRPEAPAYLLYVVARRWLGRERVPIGRADLRWALVAGVPILAYELAGFAYYGALLPATHSAKVGGGSPLVEALLGGHLGRFLGTRFLFHQGVGFAVMWCAGAVGALLAVRRLPAAAWAMSAAGLVFVAYAFTDWMPRYRFLVPPLPFLALGCAFGLERLGRLLGSQRARLGTGVAVGLVLAGAWGQATGGYDRKHNIAVAVEPRGAWPAEVVGRSRSPWEPGRQELDAWYVVRETQPGDVIACPDIGFIGALSGNPIWDIRGLVTPTAAEFLHVGDGEAMADDVRARMLDEMFALDPALILLPMRPQGMAPVARRFREALEADPRTAERYEVSEDVMPFRVVWRRKGLVPPDRRERTRSALERFPSYDTTLRETFAVRGE